MLSINHSPLDDRIFYKEAISLQNAGFDLYQIVCGTSNGAVYDMGNTTLLNPDLNKELHFNQIPTFVIPAPADSINKMLYKIFKGSFFNQYIQKGIEIKADVYHAHEPVTFYLATKIAAKTGAKVVFDSHESYTTGTPKERYILKTQIRKLKYLITANHLTRGYLLGINPQIKSQVIYNASQPEFYGTHILNSAKEFTFVHDGYLPFNRGLKTMLEAFLRVFKKYSFARLKFVGKTTGKEAIFLQDFIEQHQLHDVIKETGWLAYEKVGQALQSSQVGLIAKTGTINNIIGGPPIKYYNYTAAGLAIIDVNMPETVRLIEKYHNGIIAESNTVKGLSTAMLNLIENPELVQQLKDNSSAAFKELNWPNEAQKLVRFYKNHVLK